MRIESIKNNESELGTYPCSFNMNKEKEYYCHHSSKSGLFF